MTRAWLDTSIAHAATPRSRMRANRPCRSGASGVVRSVLTSSPAIRVPTVPTTAAGDAGGLRGRPRRAGWWWSCPGCRSRRRGAARRPGRRRRARPAGRAPRAGAATTSAGTPGTRSAPASSVSTATAPAATASAAKSMPWARCAGQRGVQVAGQDPPRAERDAGDGRRARSPSASDAARAARARRRGRRARPVSAATDGSVPAGRRSPRREGIRARRPGGSPLTTPAAGSRAWCRSAARRSGAARSS